MILYTIIIKDHQECFRYILQFATIVQLSLEESSRHILDKLIIFLCQLRFIFF